ncbi:MAG: hypothetical protein IPM34_05230 [Saprospiraceae bacterium]|nr:hypothetical protein [Saprospiraceae bacterium]
MINELFNWCVELLENWAAALGMTYEEINIWIFCIIEPIVFLLMLGYIIYLRKKINILISKETA